ESAPAVAPRPKRVPANVTVPRVPKIEMPVVPAPATPDPIAPKPGEAEFRAGMAALRANDPAGATKLFAAACVMARHEALGEDACFWVGAAAKRAGDVASARTALASFLTAFPQSARAPEAAALLGW